MEKNILDVIIERKRVEVEEQKSRIMAPEFVTRARGECGGRISFRESIESSPTGIIAEFKRRSPSKGWIFRDASVRDIVPGYSAAGAAAISVLTDTDFFGGTMEDLAVAATSTKTPLLRKEFVVDEFQIFQARLLGADAVLLIAAVLTIEKTRDLAVRAKSLGLDVLLEIHNEQELGHINEWVDAVGVNNRNLKTFVTDVQVSFDLVDKIPDRYLKISESGISDPQTVRDLRAVGYRGFLMGENFMKTDDPAAALASFIARV